MSLLASSSAPTHLVYIVLLGVFAVQVLGISLMRETVTRTPGALASLKPEIKLPRTVRGPVLAAAPVLFAVWALAGLYGALGPALVSTLTGSRSVVLGGLSLFLLAGIAAVAVIVLRAARPRTVMLTGIIALALGVVVTLASLSLSASSLAVELFYDEGVRTVGIDRVIEHAGVAKASLYNTFGSKEELIRAYLEGWHARIAARITACVERYDTPRERLLAVFEAQGETFKLPGFHGCAFMSASAEAREGDLVDQAADAYRAWVRGLFTELAEQAGVSDAASLARRLHLLYDGASISARMDDDPDAALASRAAAEVLLDAAQAESR